MLRRGLISLRHVLSQDIRTVLTEAIETSKSSGIKPIHTQRTAFQETIKNASNTAKHQTTGKEAAQSTQGLSSVPRIVKALGFGGAIPFWAFSPSIAQFMPLELLGDAFTANPATIQLVYGATIISFLGGVHWGLAMTTLTPVSLMKERYLWSVLPCLMAWPTVTMPTEQGATVQAAVLGLVYGMDRMVWGRRGLLPPWYIALRGPLTLLAASGLVLTAASSS